jgi:hypothetical protein
VALAATLTRPVRWRIDEYSRVGPLVRGHERLRERLERREERRLLALARAASEDIRSAQEREPLVTVRIVTYDRGPLIVERALSSILRQTYERLEILVVGDCCDEATERAVRSVRDPRVRFVNLPVRGSYPADRQLRWMVAGAAPANVALDLARGAWIAPCDDDDELTDDHVEVLLSKALDDRLELVHSKALMEAAPDSWWVSGGPQLAEGVAHGSILYSSSLRFMRYSMTSWKRAEPGDWNLWRRMQAIGVHSGYLDRITYVHYKGVYKTPELAQLPPTPSPLDDGRVPDWAEKAPTDRHAALAQPAELAGSSMSASKGTVST